MSNVLTGSEKHYAQHALQYYTKDLEYMAKTGIELHDIQVWLKNRNIDVPNYFLKQFLEQFNKPEIDPNIPVDEPEIKTVYKPPQKLAKTTQERKKESIQRNSKKLFNYIKNFLESRHNKPISAQELKKNHKKYTNVYYRDMLRTLAEEGCLETIKGNKRTVLYYLPENKAKNENLDTQELYWKKKALKILPEIKQILNTENNQPIDVNKIHNELGIHDISFYYNIVKVLADEDLLLKVKKGNKNFYMLKDGDYEAQMFIEESKGESETNKETVQETEPLEDLEDIIEEETRKQHDLQMIREAEIKPERIEDLPANSIPEHLRIDLIKMFADKTAIMDIKEFLEGLNVKVTYDTILQFKEEHKAELKALIETRQAIDNTIIKQPITDELSELFNIRDTKIVFAPGNRDSFWRICDILRGHAIDVGLNVDSNEGRYTIMIQG